MFFSPELLSRRDSGFGLIWLAATLGPKSNFKKLPKRSVMGADIAQLCQLISEPAEPLALRLSSNLLVGVVRVYKVKQEMFLTDVTTCFNTLKKVVQEMNSAGFREEQLQMTHPTTRPNAIDLAADPRAAFMIDFDNLVPEWDPYVEPGDKVGGKSDDEDGAFELGNKKKAKGKGKAKAPPTTEEPRDRITLEEGHDHLLTNSYDLSFASSLTQDLPFSQLDDGFGVEVGERGILDDIVDELGPDWGTSLARDPLTQPEEGDGFGELLQADPNQDVPMDLDYGQEFTFPSVGLAESPLGQTQITNLVTPVRPSTMGHGTPGDFSCMLLSQDNNSGTTMEVVNIPAEVAEAASPKKGKRARPQFDPRTELTDEELKAARANYMEGQDIIRRELLLKKIDKNSSKMMEELVWGAPRGIQAQNLVDFWVENFRIRVEARTHEIEAARPATKRRKITPPKEQEEFGQQDFPPFEGGFDVGISGIDEPFDLRISENEVPHLRSSEEPGQARQGSRPNSVRKSNLGIDLEPQGQQDSHQSSLMPWDDAIPSSSANGPFNFGDVSIGQAEIRLPGIVTRDSPLTQRGTSLIPSGGRRSSPAIPSRGSQHSDGPFQFDIPDNSISLDSQGLDANLVTLEKHSFNFLRYAKMQSQSLPASAGPLSFEGIAPKATTTRRIAAAGFYHCLVLATKDFLRLDQPVPYGPFSISIP